MAIFIVFHMSTNGKKSAGDGQGETAATENVQIKDKPQPMEIELIEMEIQGEVKKIKHSDDKCDTFYGRIGIVNGDRFDPLTITEVYEGYPGYENGMRAGDILMTPFSRIRGEVGTEVEVEFLSGLSREPKSFKTLRDKICTEKMHK